MIKVSPGVVELIESSQKKSLVHVISESVPSANSQVKLVSVRCSQLPA